MPVKSSSVRRIAALRALAERPGTEAEGKLAREILARVEAKQEVHGSCWDAFRSYLRTHSVDDLHAATRWTDCECGARYPLNSSCPNSAEHERICGEIQYRFPRGTRVYYNYWAYSVNDPGAVVGFSRHWNWVRIKFDRLKTSRSVPIYSRLGWHLSTVPMPDDVRRRRLRGITEEMEVDAEKIRREFGRKDRIDA